MPHTSPMNWMFLALWMTFPTYMIMTNLNKKTYNNKMQKKFTKLKFKKLQW